MKKWLFLNAVILTLMACNDGAEQTRQPNGASPDTTNTGSDTTKFTVQIPDYACYLYASNRDTVALKVEVFPNVVTGVLQYDFYQKDGSKGSIDGKLRGDTLVAEYDFFAEGMRSLRQVAFLIQDSVAIAGYGEMEMKNGKEVYKDISRIDFSKGLKMRRIDCQEYDPAQQSQ